MKKRPPVNVQARLIDGIITSVPCMRVNQRFCRRQCTRTFSWMPPATYCTPAHPADRIRIVERHRRRGAEAGFEIAEPLPRRRVIVLLHRIVFRMEAPITSSSDSRLVRRRESERDACQRFARVALVGDRLRRCRRLFGRQLPARTVI